MRCASRARIFDPPSRASQISRSGKPSISAPAVAAAARWVDRVLADGRRVREVLPSTGDPMPLIQSNGVELFYDLTGPDDAPVVVFSNSLGTTLEMWDAQVRSLASRYRCLRYDTRGHGRSPAVAKPTTIDTLADDLAGLLEGLGIDKAHVVGLSLGGMTAQAFAVRYPERVEGLVAHGDLRLYAAAGRLGRAGAPRARGGHGDDRGRGPCALVHARHGDARAGDRRAGAGAIPAARPARLCRDLPCDPRHGSARPHQGDCRADPRHCGRG